MDADVLLFFDKQRAALPMYEAFEQALFERLPDTRMKVQKTQISFYNKHQFCCVSFLRVRKKKELPDPYLVVTFGLEHEVQSPRIAAATEPYPNRWTHHVVLASPLEVDDELMGWVEEAAAFSAVK